VSRPGRAAGALVLLAAVAGTAAGMPGPRPAGADAEAPWTETAPPSAAEDRRLGRGEVIWRSGAAPREGRHVPGARGAVALVRIPAAPAAVWAILAAPRRYPEIFPGLRHVEMLEDTGSAWLLRTEGRVGPFDFRYHTRYELRPGAGVITWQLDRTRDNDVFDDNWGWWRLVPEPGGTLVVYAIGSLPASWQPLAGFFERRGITRALAALREAALRR
jgi:hypothetical protein